MTTVIFDPTLQQDSAKGLSVAVSDLAKVIKLTKQSYSAVTVATSRLYTSAIAACEISERALAYSLDLSLSVHHHKDLVTQIDNFSSVNQALIESTESLNNGLKTSFLGRIYYRKLIHKNEYSVAALQLAIENAEKAKANVYDRVAKNLFWLPTEDALKTIVAQSEKAHAMDMEILKNGGKLEFVEH